MSKIFTSTHTIQFLLIPNTLIPHVQIIDYSHLSYIRLQGIILKHDIWCKHIFLLTMERPWFMWLLFYVVMHLFRSCVTNSRIGIWDVPGPTCLNEWFSDIVILNRPWSLCLWIRISNLVRELEEALSQETGICDRYGVTW